jgi:hypothetical protein
MRIREVWMGAILLGFLAAFVLAEQAPPPGPTVAALITQRYAELVQQQLVFPLDPSTPNTPENQLDAIVNHFRGLSVQYQRLDTRFRQSEQVVGMLSVSNGKLTERLQKLQTTPPPVPGVGLAPSITEDAKPPEEK